MDGITDQLGKHSKSWSPAVTDLRSTKHSHSWKIRGFSQAECEETVFKPVSSANDVSPTFRVRLLAVDQNYIHLSLFSDDLPAKYFARINLYNGRNQKIITKSFYNDIPRADHVEVIPRQTLLSQIGPEDELRIEIDLTITFDTTVTGKGDKTAEQGINPKGDQSGSKLSPPVVNQYLLRTVVISLSCPDSNTQHPAVALVDTGAAVSLITPSAAQAYGAWRESKVPVSFVVGVGGRVAVYGQVLMDVRILHYVLHRQRFNVVDFKTAQDVILGIDFHDAVGSITFHKNSMQVNGGETIPYTSGKSVVSKSVPMNPKANKPNPNAKVGTTVATPNKPILNKAAPSQAASKLSQSGVNQFLARTALISLSTSDSDTQRTEVALVDSGAARSLIKPSVAQVLGIWIETRLAMGTAVVTGAAAGSLPVYGQMFLDVRIGNSVRREQRFIVADFKTAQDVILGTDFCDAVGSVTFLKDCMQVNGQTIPYAFGTVHLVKGEEKGETRTEEERAKEDNDRNRLSHTFAWVPPDTNVELVVGMGKVAELSKLKYEEGEAVNLPVTHCHACEESFADGDIGVYTQHTANSAWHPSCFRCSTCKNLLMDMLYFCKDGQYYCGRHFGDTLYPRCGGCDELIFAKEYTHAEGRDWHLNHFCCFGCDLELGGHRYMIREDKNPYCITCYMSLFARTCRNCEEKIGPDVQRVTHKEMHWHATNECFHCSQCRHSLLGTKFVIKQDNVFCSGDCKRKFYGQI